MKTGFIKIFSPLSLIIILFFDFSALLLGWFSVKSILKAVTFYTVSFVIIELVVTAVAVMITVQIFKNGVMFYEDRLEFTGLDDNNVFHYEDIVKAETYKDTSASLNKKYVERYSSVILRLFDGTVATVELGMTTKRQLKRIENEINNRLKTQESTHKNNGTKC